jgi:hypothetical protein
VLHSFAKPAVGFVKVRYSIPEKSEQEARPMKCPDEIGVMVV